MRNPTLVYLNSKCLALKLMTDYNHPGTFYSAEDELFAEDGQKVIDFTFFLNENLYSNNLWYRNRAEVEKEHRQALKLSGSTRFSPVSANDGGVVIQVTDPDYLKNQASFTSSSTGRKKNGNSTSGNAVPPMFKNIPLSVSAAENHAASEIYISIGSAREARSSCNCRLSPCRHMMAVAEFLMSEERKLKDAYIHSSKPGDKSFFLSDSLESLIDNCADGHPDELSPARLSLLEKTVKEITSVHSESYFDGVILHLLSLSPYGWDEYDSRLLECYAPLIGAFYTDPFLHDILSKPDFFNRFSFYCGRQYKSNLTTLKRELKSLQTAEKNLRKGKTGDTSHKKLLLKCSGDADALLQFYAREAPAFFPDDLSFLDYYLENYRHAPEDIRTQILKKADELSHDPSGEHSGVIHRLLQTFPPEEQAVRLSMMKNHTLDLKTYRLLSPDLQKQLAGNMAADKANLEYILNIVAKDFDGKKMAGLILKMAGKLEPYRSNREEAELLAKTADRLKDNTLLLLYLAFRFDLTGRLSGMKNTRISDADIRSYFSAGFLVTDDAGEVKTHYFLFSAEDLPAAEAEEALSAAELEKLYGEKSVLDFYEQSGRLKCLSGPGQLLTYNSLKCIADIALEGRQEESDRKKQEMQEAIDARNFEKEHSLFAADYKNLCNDLKEGKILLTDSFKVNLTYLFDFSEEAVLLGFKVGNTKDYIVKNANDFISAFRTGETVTYGKDLVLTHDIDNLKEEDRPVIRLLSPLRYAVVGSGLSAKRYLPLTGPLLSNVMDLLKGRTVMVGDVSACVRLDPVEIKVEINDNYELKAGFPPETRKILYSGTRAYLYTCNSDGDAFFDYIKGDTDQIKVLEFASNNSGVSIRPILNDFKRNIYSRFYDSFHVAESIRNDFKLSVIRINAYFDYADKAITLRTEYLKEGKEISRDGLTDRMDKVKADNFDTAIAGLGFENQILSDEGGILSFLKMDFSGLKRQASVYLSEALSSKKLVSLNRQVIRVSYSKSGIIDAVLEKSDFTEEELADILQAMKRKQKFALLSGDRIIDLDSEEAKDFRDAVKDFGLESGKLYKKKRLNMVEALKAFAHENSCSIDRQLRAIVDEIRSFKECDIKPPELSYEMREYQKEGFRWLSILSKYNLGGILADDMGLGKTLQIIALIKSDKAKKPSLIVCPKSLVFNWINEFSRFDGETSVTEIYGLSDKRAEIINGIDYSAKTVFITSYDSLRNDIDLYSGDFNYCVLDEAQYIKNVTAQKSRSVKAIKADHRFALTGTPIENNIIDLWSIFDFIMPGYFEGLSEFRSMADQEDFHAQVAKRIGPFVLRRIKENVLADLPPKYETVLSCEMTVPQRKAYEALRKKARDIMSSGSKAFDLLPMLMRLRQICVDPAMCVDGYEGGSGKMEILNDLIPRYLSEGHRILLFSQFVKGLNQVEDLLKKHGIDYYMLTGETPAKERGRMIDEFNSTAGTDVFLISLKAGGTGLNLTGADTVVHLDPWWNSASENQATDRAHRIGQTKNVEVIRLVSEDSIEQRVIELQNLKKDLIDRVISNDESSVTGASLEDIAYILN